MVEYAVLLVAVMLTAGVGFKVLGVKALVSAVRASSVVSAPQLEPPAPPCAQRR